MGEATDITGLLVALGEGEEGARTRLVEAVYRRTPAASPWLPSA